MNLIGKPKLIRKINKKLILRFIRQKQIITKTELCELSGLSKQTINNIMNSLLNKKLVLETGFGESTEEGGKRPLLYKFNSKAYYLAGILMEGNITKCGITDLNGKILIENHINLELQIGPEKVVKKVIELIDKTVSEVNISHEKLLGIGIGIPGIIDFKNGIVNILTSFPIWKYTPLKDMIKNKFKVPVVIDNEANIRALGEKYFGLGIDKDNFITINTTKKGIGAGIVINKDIFRGSNFLSGEIGQILLNINYNSNKYENLKTLEYLLSQHGINKLIKENMKKGNYKSSPLLSEYNKESEISLDDLFNYFNNNPEDEFIRSIMDKIAHIFAIGLTNVICTFDTDLIIIHGKFSILIDEFFKKVKKVVKKNIFCDINKNIEIVKSINSKEMGIIGAASMVLDVIDIF